VIYVTSSFVPVHYDFIMAALGRSILLLICQTLEWYQNIPGILGAAEMMERNSMHYRYFEKEQRRTRRLRVISYVLLGLLAAATAVVVLYALTR
jgi:hypothetical protein